MNFEQIWKEIKELYIEDQDENTSINNEYKEILKPLNQIIEFEKKEYFSKKDYKI